LYNFFILYFFKSIIRYVGFTYRKINLIINWKKKVVGVVEKLYKSCKPIISQSIKNLYEKVKKLCFVIGSFIWIIKKNYLCDIQKWKKKCFEVEF
jgi:hypothetical protein